MISYARICFSLCVFLNYFRTIEHYEKLRNIKNVSNFIFLPYHPFQVHHMDLEKSTVERSKSVHVTLVKKDSSGKKKVKCTNCMEEVSNLCIVGSQIHWTCKPCGLYGDFCDPEKQIELKKQQQLAKMKRRMSLPASQIEAVLGKNNLQVSRSNSKTSSGRARRASIYEIELAVGLALDGICSHRQRR